MKQLVTRFGLPSLFALGLLVGGTAGFAIAQTSEPHMQSALDSLRNAQYQLNQATANKNGHRANALNYVNEAIQEVKWGIVASGGTPH